MPTLDELTLHVQELRRLLADADRIAEEAVTNAAEIRQTVGAIRGLLDDRSSALCDHQNPPRLLIVGPRAHWAGAPLPSDVAAARPGWSVLRGGAER